MDNINFKNNNLKTYKNGIFCERTFRSRLLSVLFDSTPSFMLIFKYVMQFFSVSFFKLE